MTKKTPAPPSQISNGTPKVLVHDQVPGWPMRLDDDVYNVLIKCSWRCLCFAGYYSRTLILVMYVSRLGHYENYIKCYQYNDIWVKSRPRLCDMCMSASRCFLINLPVTCNHSLWYRCAYMHLYVCTLVIHVVCRHAVIVDEMFY